MNQDVTIKKLRCEYQLNPVGIDVKQPRLSWQIQCARRNFRQTSYRILISDSLAVLAENKGNVWDSKRVTSHQNTLIKLADTLLVSRQRYFWKVMIWGERDKRTEWSSVAFWEMGLLSNKDWQAKWTQNSSDSQSIVYLQKRFSTHKTIKLARLYATAVGCYELFLNGTRVSDDYFRPSWSSSQHFLQYQTYDVTPLLQNGANGIGAILTGGWERRGAVNGRQSQPIKPALRLQLEIVGENGKMETIVTDDSWSTTSGPLLAADHFLGEVYDARLEIPNWATAACDLSKWDSVVVDNSLDIPLVAQIGAPVRKKYEISPQAILTAPNGDIIVDFGQNFVGWVRLCVTGEAGTAVTLHHAEMLDQTGNLYTDNLRTATQKVTYICRGSKSEVYEPQFTFYGFRYVKVEGFPDELTLDSLTGIVAYSDLEATGYFECSNEKINQLQRNIVWSQRSNFLDVPTDCPQRDERLGWTGDIQTFAKTAGFNMDVALFLSRWLKNLRSDQRSDGAFPFVSPHTLDNDDFGAAGWGDAGIIVPWTLYCLYGDKQVLAENYRAMQLWIHFMGQRAGETLLWQGDFQFGDWLATDRLDLGTPFGLTETDLIATAYFAYSTSLMAKIAAVFGREEDAKAYGQVAAQIKTAFCREYVTANGRLTSNTQTAYALALAFNLLPEALRPKAVERLVADIQNRGVHLSTGFLGTPHLCHVLSESGQTDLAYALLLQETFPSWLYPQLHGATTIWERWDGIQPDGAFQDPNMNSFNHYAYGAIGDWLYRVVAGLSFDELHPGYKQAIIKPRLGGELTYAKAVLDTVHGRFRSQWRWTEEHLIMEVDVPPNATAMIYFPTSSISGVRESGRPLTQLNGLRETHSRNKQLTAVVGSGQYVFKIARRFYRPVD